MFILITLKSSLLCLFCEKHTVEPPRVGHFNLEYFHVQRMFK